MKAYYDAPDTWIEGQEYVFVHRNHDDIKRIKKIRVQDPNAVMGRDESGKTESLYQQYMCTVDEHISHELLFIDDSTVVINQSVYHRAEETVQVMYDSNVSAVQGELPAIDMPQYVSACRSTGTYVVTSDGGKYEYEIQLWKDTCDEDLDFIVFNKLLISCDNQIKESISDEFDWLDDSHYKADAAHPFYTFSLGNGCTLLLFEINGRPDIPQLLMYALKDGSVTRAYCGNGAIVSMKNENGSISLHQMTDQGEWSNRIMEGVDIYYSPQKYGDLFIREGKLIRVDYK